MNSVVSRTAIREAILRMDKPFCVSDLIARLHKEGISDTAFIIQVLNELYSEGLVEYNKQTGMVDEPNVTSEWAFSVAS